MPKLPKRKPKGQRWFEITDLEEYLGNTAAFARRLNQRLERIEQFKADMDSEIYRDTLGRHFLCTVCRHSIMVMEKLLEGTEYAAPARSRRSLAK